MIPGSASTDGGAGTAGGSPRQERLPARDTVDEVAPGVGRIQLPLMIPGLGHVNCYLLEDRRGVTLIDPGMPDPTSHAVLVRRLESIGIRPERIHTVVVTHSHPDHFGGAGRLRVEHDSAVVAHRSFATPFDADPAHDDLAELTPAVEHVVDGASPTCSGPVNRRLAEVLFGEGPLPEIPPRPTPWGEDGFRPGPGELDAMRAWDDLSKRGLLQLTPSVRVDDLEVIRLGDREWQVIHTPGHTGDHICLLDPAAGILLSGDHVLPTITPHISGLTDSTDPLAEFVTALRRVADLDGVTKVLPAHGLPFEDLRGRVDAIVGHHEDRLAQIESLAEQLGDARVRDYSRHLFQERSWGPMAESETYAHLEHLRHGGRMAAAVDPDGFLRYRPVTGDRTAG